MSNFKNFITVFSFFLFGFQAFAQPGSPPVLGQIILYVNQSATQAEIDAEAALINSTITSYPDPGQNIALADWHGPFTIDGVYIPSIVEIASYIASDNNKPPGQQSLPEIDGGVNNHSISVPTTPGGSSFPPALSACYPAPYIGPSTKESINLGLFDTGTEYELAQDNGYVFYDVKELNGNVIDLNGHGTHVGTLIDETYHNTVQENNLNYFISNTFDSNGFISLGNVILAIEDALQHNLHVVNLSFSYPGISQEADPLFRLIHSATNTLFVVAAGNDGNTLDGSDTYFPGAFDLGNVLTVGSYECGTGHRGGPSKASFSNYSSTHVDLLAPGINLSAMNHLGNIVDMSGTSQSTAIVSATAAAVASNMTTFDPIATKCIILSNVHSHSSLNAYALTGGVLNIQGAIDNMTCDGITIGRQIIEEETLDVQMSPNPFTSDLNITIELTQDDNIQLEIYDISGKQLQVISGNAYEGINEYSLNFDEIAFQNQYILRIKTSDSVVTKRVIRIE